VPPAFYIGDECIMLNAECKMIVSALRIIFNHRRRRYHNYALCILNYALYSVQPFAVFCGDAVDLIH